MVTSPIFNYVDRELVDELVVILFEALELSTAKVLDPFSIRAGSWMCVVRALICRYKSLDPVDKLELVYNSCSFKMSSADHIF